MTLEEAMKTFNGEWNAEGFAVIRYKDGYYWRIAQKIGDKVELTRDGNRLLGTPSPLANTSTSKVESTKKREKKPVQPVADVDDLDI